MNFKRKTEKGLWAGVDYSDDECGRKRRPINSLLLQKRRNDADDYLSWLELFGEK